MVVIVKYGEIAIKGQNKCDFIKRLIKNIRNCLTKNNIDFDDIKSFQNRILIYTKDNCNCLKYVYGIANFSHAEIIKTDLDIIKEKALEMYEKGSFRISTKRVNKVLKNSNEINRDVGSYIVEKTNAKVNLTKPDTTIWIDVMKNQTLVYSEKIEGLKGLPVGSEGEVAVLLENEDSILAGKLMMKRGCKIILVNINNINWDELKKYEYGFKLKVYNKVPNFVQAIVTSEKINNLQKRDFEKVVLRPLIIF